MPSCQAGMGRMVTGTTTERLGRTSGAGAGRQQCEANQPSPREGCWFTAAKAGSRLFFEQGELVVPDLKSG